MCYTESTVLFSSHMWCLLELSGISRLWNVLGLQLDSNTMFCSCSSGHEQGWTLGLLNNFSSYFFLCCSWFSAAHP